MRSFTRDGLEPTESAEEYAARVGVSVARKGEGETELTQLHRERVARLIALRELRDAREEMVKETRVEKVLRVVFGVGRTEGWQ